MKRVLFVMAMGVGVLSGCKSPEDKMVSICTDIAKMSVADPSSLVVNSGSVVEAVPTKESLFRFATLNSDGELSGARKVWYDLQVKELDKLKESYASIDYTDKSSVARRGQAICWFMDRGKGPVLGSVSVAGKSYSGIDLLSVFVSNSRPKYLNSSNEVE
ncbi:hypothetical protein [Pseudomonas laurentiana]